MTRFPSVACSLVACCLWVIMPSCSRKSDEALGDPKLLCRISENIYDYLAGSKTNIGVITVAVDGNYVESYTNRWNGHGLPTHNLQGRVPPGLLNLLSESVRSKKLWTRIDGVPTFSLSLDDQHSSTPHGVTAILELARMDFWREGTEPRDRRLCKFIAGCFLQRTGSWTNFEDLMIYRDGWYVQHSTNVWKTDTFSYFAASGRIDQAEINLLCRSLIDLRQWKTIEGVPTFSFGINDSKTVKPGGFEPLAVLMSSNSWWYATNGSPPR